MIAADFELFSSPFCLQWCQIEIKSIVIKHQPKFFFQKTSSLLVFFNNIIIKFPYESVIVVITIKLYLIQLFSIIHFQIQALESVDRYITLESQQKLAQQQVSFFDFTKNYFSRKNVPISSIQTNQDARIQVSKW